MGNQLVNLGPVDYNRVINTVTSSGLVSVYRGYVIEWFRQQGWVVTVKGNRMVGFEIALVRIGNAHGYISCGWIDKDKQLVIDCKVGKAFGQKLYRQMIDFAVERCNELNGDEHAQVHYS